MNVVTTQSNTRWLEEVDSAVFGDSTDLSLMLTGGRSAKKLYDHWLKMDWFSSYNIDCYFGDERCVLPDSLESNYGMVMNTLFVEGVPDGCRVHRMKGEQVDFEREAARYASILPDSIDVLLLSVGEDGHIASIFPGSEVLYDETSPVRHIHAPKPPVERLTITPKVLKFAKKIVVLACGSEKGKVVAEALKQPSTTQELPITLVFGESKTTIILDKEASEQLQ